MEQSTLYINRIPFKTIFVIEVISGSFLLSFFIILFRNEIYLDVWTFAGPLLGIALILNGLFGSKIKEINVYSTNRCIEIKKETIFKTKIKKLDICKMTVELKTANGKKNSLIPKLRLIILDTDKEIEELKSGFLSMNNEKIEKLFTDLKAIKKNN